MPASLCITAFDIVGYFYQSTRFIVDTMIVSGTKIGQVSILCG